MLLGVGLLPLVVGALPPVPMQSAQGMPQLKGLDISWAESIGLHWYVGPLVRGPAGARARWCAALVWLASLTLERELVAERVDLLGRRVAL